MHLYIQYSLSLYVYETQRPAPTAARSDSTLPQHQFVVDAIISDTGELVPLAIPLSIDIPEVHNGTIIDPCYYNINSPDCTYDLALHSLSSQLVTYQEYTIAGVTFQPPNGTMGLPYHAMKHFREEVANIPFEDARRRYCLPVLDPQVIKCEEVLINGTTCASEDNFVKFKSLNVSDTNAKTGKPQDLKTGLYKITSPYPNNLSAWGEFGLRIDSQGKGVMIINQFLPEPFTTLVGAANAWGEIGYASMLHRLMFDGVNPDYSGVPPGGTYDFAARCKLTSIRDHDAIASSWRQVDFTLSRGVLHANVTEERCPNARSPNGEGISGFSDLPYALQGAGDIVSSTDGYSKFFNEHPPSGQGSEIFATMSRFETVVNQIYHIIQTHWTESSYDYAMQVPRVHEQPVMMTSYPHLFVIRISWTPTTYIGLVLSLLIALNAIALAWRWARATYCFGFGDETWNLLRPVDLMAYSLAATHDLIDSLNTRDHRRMEMRGTSKTVLREHLDDLKNPIAGAGAEIPGSESTSGSPLREYYREKIQTETTAPEISVQERQPGLEQGQRRT